MHVSYSGRGIEYGIEKDNFDREALIDSIKRHIETNPTDTAIICIADIAEVRFSKVLGDIHIHHLRVYDTGNGYGSRIIDTFSDVAKNRGMDEISIEIGTEEGIDKTKYFLRKNGFDIISEKYEGVYGKVVNAEKEI